MASNVIDYFATLGRKALICKSFKSLWADDKAKIPSEIWNEAITDIAIVHYGESLPDSSWQIIDHSIDDRPISSRSTIAVRRRAASKRLDHITKIKLIKKGDVIPMGFELIDRSISKTYPAEIENVGVLAVKRAKASEITFIQGEPLVDDICLVLMSEGEEVPEGYVSLERPVTAKEANRNSKSIIATKIVVAYHQRPAMGLIDLSYESVTLDRYPQKDQIEFPLPVTELPMFAFPHDLRLSYSSTIRFPLPVFFSFVFTNAKGMHRYAACLRFYEIVPKDEIESVFRDVYGPDQDLKLLPNTAVFCPKIICVVSQMPFYRAMRRYLCQIFSMSLSSLPCPLEFFIASVVGQVPLPVAGGRPFYVIQDAALISSTSCAMNAIEFEVPLPRFFPPMDLDFAAPLRCLSVDRLLAVFALMLRESKMVFLCCSNTLLTETMETLRSLLFPLKWSSCFVSRLPDALSGLLEAPGGFMLGLHMFEDKENDVEVVESHMDKHFGDRKAVRQVEWTHSLTAGTFIVDLSSNAVFQYEGKQEQTPLSSSAISNLVMSLPPGPRKRLQKKLQCIASEYLIGPQTVGLDRFDSAFDFQSYEDIQEPAAAVSAEQWEKFPTLEIRDSFMSFMADLLGNYQRYIIPPLEDMSADTYRTFKEEFSVEEYLQDAGPTVRPVLALLVETQMFAVLLQQRSEASDYSLVFFESAGELMREYKLQAGGHGVKDSSGRTFTSSTTIPDMHAPLYKLLEAKAWAAANGKYHHMTDTEKVKEQIQIDEESSMSNSLSGQIVSDVSAPPKTEEKSFFSLRNRPISSKFLGGPSLSKKEPQKSKTSLDYLLAALDEMELEAARIVLNLNTENNIAKRKGVVGARNELDRGANLRLHDRSLGPLIIPGPSKALLNTSFSLVTKKDRSRSFRSHSILSVNQDSKDICDDTNSVMSCSTDASDNESVSCPLSAKSNVEIGTGPYNSDNHYGAMIALRTRQNRSPSQTEECNEIEYESDVERDSEGRFTYQIGWPVFHSKLLKLARKSVHTRLSGLRKSRIFALQMIDRNIHLFLRAPTEQWACYRSLSLHGSERSIPDMDTSTSVRSVNSTNTVTTQNNLRSLLTGSQSSVSLVNESYLVTNAVLEVYSVSLLLLCTRTLHEAKPLCDMLQVLGILAQADHMGILHKFDETIWRALLVACAITGGDVMRKIACVIFDTLTACGVTPDALTYGSYTRALAATKCTKPFIGRQQMDQFLFLEEIGLAWFQQRSAVIEQSQSDYTEVESRAMAGSARKSSGLLEKMFARKRRNAPLIRRRNNNGFEMTGASDSAFTTATQLGLIRSSAALSLYSPPGTFLSAPPRHILSFRQTEALEFLSIELSSRIQKLILDYKPPSPPPFNKRGRKPSIILSDIPERKDLEDEADRKSDTESGSTVAEAMKDLFGAGASTASHDTSEGRKNSFSRRNSGSTGEERSAAFASALIDAVNTSSAAVGSVKDLGNKFISRIPSGKRRPSYPNNSVPVEVLHEMIGSRGVDRGNDREGKETALMSMTPETTSRMSRLTQAVFHNPFASKNALSNASPSTSFAPTSSFLSPFTHHTTKQADPQPLKGSNDTKSGGERGRSETYGQIGFSDDEGDEYDSDQETRISRRSTESSFVPRSLRFPAESKDPDITYEIEIDVKTEEKEDDSYLNFTKEQDDDDTLKIAADDIDDNDDDSKHESEENPNDVSIIDSSSLQERAVSPLSHEFSPSELENVSRTLSPIEILQLLQMPLAEDNNHCKNDINLEEVDVDPNEIEEEMKDFREEKNIQFSDEITEIVDSVSIWDKISNLEDGIENGTEEDCELMQIVEKVTEQNASPQQLSSQNKAPRLLLIKPPVKPPKDAPYIKAAKEVPNDKPYMIPTPIPNGNFYNATAAPDTNGSIDIPYTKPFKDIPHGKVELSSRNTHHNVANGLSNRLSDMKRIDNINNVLLEESSGASAFAPLAPLVTPVYTGPNSLPSTFQTKVSNVNKRLNILAMQNDLQSTFSSAFVNEGRAIGIHSATPCPSCGYVMLEEETMAAWCRLDPPSSSSSSVSSTRGGKVKSSASSTHFLDEPNLSTCESTYEKEASPVSSLSDMRDGDIEAAHYVLCPICSSKYSPQLHIHCYDLKNVIKFSPAASDALPSVKSQWIPLKCASPISAVSSPEVSLLGTPNKLPEEDHLVGSEDELNILWRASFPRLSPKGLRLALEEQMDGIGERVTDPCWLHVHRPAVYWNIIWFSSRLSVPTGFLAAPTPSTPPISPSKNFPDIDGNNLECPERVQMWHLPSIIGWRKDAVKAKIRNLLSPSHERIHKSGSLPNNSSPAQTESHREALRLTDLFPGCEDVPQEYIPNISTSGSIDSHPTNLAAMSPSISPTITRSISSPGPIHTLLGTNSSVSRASPGSIGTRSQISASSLSKTPMTPSLRLERTIELLDGSVDGMKRAVMEIGKYQRLMAENKFCRLESYKSDDGTESESKYLDSHNQRRYVNNDFQLNSPHLNGSERSTNIATSPISNYDSSKKAADRINQPYTVARSIYIDLLTLFYFQKSKELQSYVGDPSTNTKQADLFKEPIFEKLYLQAVRDLLSLKDFETLGTTEGDMLSCIAGRTAQAYRIGFGFLL